MNTMKLEATGRMRMRLEHRCYVFNPGPPARPALVVKAEPEARRFAKTKGTKQLSNSTLVWHLKE